MTKLKKYIHLGKKTSNFSIGIDEKYNFNDIPLLRRELISKQYLIRTDDCSLYWKD